LKRAKHNRLLIEERMLQYIRYLNFKSHFLPFLPGFVIQLTYKKLRSARL